MRSEPRSIRLIILTHGHWDHVGSAKDIQEITGGKIVMRGRERDWLEKALKPLPPPVTTWGRILSTIGGQFVRLVHFPTTTVDMVLGDGEVPPARSDLTHVALGYATTRDAASCED